MRLKTWIFLYLLISSIAVGYVYAGENTCMIAAPTQDDIWVIVYDADADGNRGEIIWKGKIAAGQNVSVNSTDGHIRYQYAFGPDESYAGDTDRLCVQNDKIQLP